MKRLRTDGEAVPIAHRKSGLAGIGENNQRQWDKSLETGRQSVRCCSHSPMPNVRDSRVHQAEGKVI